MAKVRDFAVSWDSSTSIDVVSYNFFWRTDDGVFDLDQTDQLNVGFVTTIRLPGDVPGFPLVDQDIAIAVTAVDDQGNQSDFIELVYPFDFVAPAAPTNLAVSPI